MGSFPVGSRPGRTAFWLLLVLATTCAVGAAACRWASSDLADADTFATRATDALDEEEVNRLVAERLVDRFGGDSLLATSARPVAVGLVRGVLTSDEFAGVFQSSVRTAHEQLVSGRDDSVVVAAAGAAPLVVPALDPVAGSGASAAAGGRAVIAVVDDPALVQTAQLLGKARTASVVLVLGWLVLSALALVISPDRRRGLRRMGLGLVVGGALLGVAVAAARSAVGLAASPDETAAAAEAVVVVFTRSLLVQAGVLVLLGAVLVACATGRPTSMLDTVRSATTRARAATSWPWVRVAAPAAALGLGWWLVVDPLTVLDLVARLVGLALVFTALTSILGQAGRLLDRRRPAAAPVEGALRGLGSVALTAVVAVAVLGALSAATLAPSAGRPAPPDPDPDRNGCNGLVALCDRRLDQVALVGSHNAMSSSAEPGWFLAEQGLPISGQLAAGARSLMLDIYPGYRSGDRVRTDLRVRSTADAAAADVTPEQRAALDRLGLTVGAIPPAGADVRPYLCHAYCEIGASDLVEKLRDVADFLTYNPDDVVVLILQDYQSGELTQDAFEEAGLFDRVWPLDADGPWPSLREMVLAHRTLVVLSENHGGEVSWMPAAYDVTEETPYEFAAVSEMTCAVNRGGTGKPFFLVNHWVLGKTQSAAAVSREVNTRSVLEDRLATCAAERGRRPGILAVNHIEIGDAMAVVADLNPG